MSFLSAGTKVALDLLSLAVVLPLSLVTAALCCELALGIRPPPPADFGTDEPPNTIVVVPAHNEEAGIAATLRAIFRAGFADMRVLVVADNCSDTTASLAIDCGALVVERNDPGRPGKGFALARAQEHIRQMTNRPIVVTVIDADCRPEANALALLSRAAAALSRPVQARYLLTAPANAPATVQFGNFAFFIKNGVRQRGLKRLGAPALLNGTGMSFTWTVFDQADLASASLVEDLDLGIALSVADCPPFYLEQAVVLSEAASAMAMVAQRSRWEGGFIGAASQIAPALIRVALASGSWPKLWSGVDLLVPPLTILAFLNFSAIIAAYLISVWTGSSLAWVSLATANIVLALLLAICWYREGRLLLSARALFFLPVYMMWKIPLYWKLVWQKPAIWIRTERNQQ